MVMQVETVAYSGDQPWKLVGKEVNPSASPKQMLKSAGLDWGVEKVPAFVEIGDEKITIDRAALIRSSDQHILSVVSNDWNPLQNQEAFEFYRDFNEAGNLEMYAAGSLKKGELVWALAKIDESFALFDGEDVVQSFLLFTNPHRFGKSIDIRFMPIRMASWTSLSMALTHATITQARVSHRVKFDPVAVKDTLDIAHEKMIQYRSAAEHLATKRVTREQAIDYFKEIFPLLSQRDEPRRDISRMAKMCTEVMNSYPGAELGQGTWWSIFNAVCYAIDHLAGRNEDNRLESAWFGMGKDTKSRAIDVALERAG